MSEYCKYCETEITEDFNEFPCCDAEVAKLKGRNKKLKDSEIFQKNLANGFKQKSNKLEKENAELREEKEFLISEFINYIERELWRWQELEAKEYVLGLLRDRSKANEAF